MSEVRDILMRTKRLFTSGQWTRGALISDGNDGVQLYCLVGGLRHSSGANDVYLKPRGNKPYIEAVKLLADVVRTGDRVGSIIGPATDENVVVIYNDRVARNAGDVVALIDRAVEKAS